MSPTKFGFSSTTEEVLDGVDMSGMRVLVTGVSAGLGIETARVLVDRGAHIIGTARDIAKAEDATDTIARSRGEGPGLTLMACDLASIASVRACAGALVAEGKKLDAIIANAGVMACPFGRTVDGFEMQFGTNHLGHFVLVNQLAPLLQNGSRVVILSSAGHRYSDVDLEDPNFAESEYVPLEAYGRSKTANILFALEFDRRHRDRGIRATAVHPGAIATELTRHMTPEITASLVKEASENQAPDQTPFRWKSVPEGAATTVWAGFVAEADAVGGRYCEDCQVAEVAPPEARKGVRSYAMDAERAKALWALSERMVHGIP